MNEWMNERMKMPHGWEEFMFPAYEPGRHGSAASVYLCIVLLLLHQLSIR